MHRIRFLFPAAALLLAAASGGCTRPDDGVTHLQFSIWGSVEQEKVEREVVAAFEAAHPAIRIDLLAIGSQYPAKIQAMMVGDAAPDVVMVGIDQYYEWASRGVLLDLTDDLAAVTRGEAMFPIPRDAFAWKGRCYALPVNCHGMEMYVNRDAFRAAGLPFPGEGLTWEKLDALAPKLSRRHGDPRAPTDYAYELPNPMILFWAFGAHLFDDPVHPTRVTVRSSEAREALDFMRRALASGYVVPSDVQGDQGDYQLFRDGKVALYFNGRWSTPNFEGKTAFDWDVAPIPAGPAGRTTYHGGTALAVWKGSPHAEAAREFVRFYASPEGERIAMRGKRNVPVFRALASSPEFLALTPPASLACFVRTMEEGGSAYPLYAPGSAEVAQIFGGRMEQALSQPGIPADRILAGLEADLNRWLEARPRP